MIVAYFIYNLKILLLKFNFLSHLKSFEYQIKGRTFVAQFYETR